MSLKNWHWWRVVCDLTSHSNTSQENWHWWRVACDLTSHNNTSQKDWHWWRVVCDLTSHSNTSQKNWHWWRVVCDLTSHNNTSQKNWHWWRVVCDSTSHNNTSQKNWHWWRVVWGLTSHSNTSQKNNRLWHRVVTKGSGDFGKWWLRLREVATKESGEEGKWWRREWWWRECCKMHCNGCMNVVWGVFWGGSRSTKPCVVRVKWLRPAMTGIPPVCGRCGCGRFIREFVPPLCSARSGCSCVRSSMRVLSLWLQIALEWLHDCCHLVLPCV